MILFYFVTFHLINITLFSPSLKISDVDSYEIYIYKILFLQLSLANYKPFINLLDRLNRMTISVDKIITYLLIGIIILYIFYALI